MWTFANYDSKYEPLVIFYLKILTKWKTKRCHIFIINLIIIRQRCTLFSNLMIFRFSLWFHLFCCPKCVLLFWRSTRLTSADIPALRSCFNQRTRMRTWLASQGLVIEFGSRWQLEMRGCHCSKLLFLNLKISQIERKIKHIEGLREPEISQDALRRHSVPPLFSYEQQSMEY